MIGGLLSGIATSPWMRAALRYGAIALAVLLLALLQNSRREGFTSRIHAVRRAA